MKIVYLKSVRIILLSWKSTWNVKQTSWQICGKLSIEVHWWGEAAMFVLRLWRIETLSKNLCSQDERSLPPASTWRRKIVWRLSILCQLFRPIREFSRAFQRRLEERERHNPSTSNCSFGSQLFLSKNKNCRSKKLKKTLFWNTHWAGFLDYKRGRNGKDSCFGNILNEKSRGCGKRD